MNTNALAFEPSPKFQWNEVALDTFVNIFARYVFQVNAYERGKQITSAVVIAEDKQDAINLVYANQDLSETIVDIEVKLLGLAVNGIDRQVVLNTAV